MRYEWDETENQLNQRKHGVSFEIAVLVFADIGCLVTRDRIDSGGEQRWHAIGSVEMELEAAALLVVVHVYREDEDGEEITRIISARAASQNDIRRYQAQAVD